VDRLPFNKELYSFLINSLSSSEIDSHHINTRYPVTFTPRHRLRPFFTWNGLAYKYP
jgi:hypothetical protein